MKKRILSVLLAFAMIFTLMPTALAAPTTYQVVTVDKTTVQAGETVNVKVTLPEGIQTAGSFTANLKFDMTLFEVVSRVAPPKISATDEGYGSQDDVKIFANTAAIANTSGELTANAAYTYNTMEVAGVTVIDATLKAKASGVAAFSFSIFEITYSDNGTQYIVKKDQLEAPPSVTIPKAPITSVSAKVDAPQKGVALDTTVDVGGATAYTGTVKWYVGETEATETIAKANTEYTAKITLTASSGESFDAALDNTTTTEGYEVKKVSNTELLLIRTFDATAIKDTPTINTVPTASAITYGQKLSNSTLSGGAASVTGNFTWKTPSTAPQVKDSNSTEYEVVFTPTNTASYETATCKVKLKVNPKSLASISIIPIDPQPYTGLEIKPDVTVKDGQPPYDALAESDYSVAYSKNKDVGTADIVISPKVGGNYSFAAGTFHFTIKPADSSISITGDPSKPYDGNVVNDPAVNKSGSTGAVTYTYYTDAACTTKTTTASGAVSDGTAPKNAGDYWVKATLAADSNYGSVTSAAKKFTISQKALTNDMIILGTQATYDGTAHGPVYSVKDGATVLNKGTDYTETSGYSPVTNVGNTTLKISGAGNYKGTAQKDWSLVSKDVTITPDAKSKTYGAADPELTYSTDLTAGSALETAFNTAKSGTLSYTGTDVGAYIIGIGTLKAGNNFNLKMNATPVFFTINQATPVITATTPRQLVNNGVEVDISNWASFTNTDSGATLTYTLDTAPAGITLVGNKLKAASSVAAGSSFDIKVNAYGTHNFTAPTEFTITVNVVNKVDAGVSITTPPASKTYGDADFTLTATKTAPDGGTWSWNSSNTAILEIISGADTATPTIKVKKADTTGATLTVTYTSSTHYGSANATITVAPKTLTAADLTHSGPITKVYDTNTNAPTGLTVSVKSGSLVGTDTLAVTGTLKYNSANVNEANKITFTPTAITTGNYRLAATEVLTITGAKITAKDVKLTGGINATDRSYVKDNKTVDLTKGTLTFDGLVGSETLDVNIPATGTISDAKVGAYNVTYSGVTLADGTGKASNYKLVSPLPAVMVNITKAAALTLADIPVSQKFTTTTGEKAIGAVMPTDAGALTYTKDAESKTGSVTVTSWDVDSTGKVTYTLSGGVAGDTVTLPVTIGSDNYENSTVNVKITLTAKDDQTALTLTGGTTVVYGQTLQLGTTGGNGTGAVTYAVTNGTGEATIDATGKLTPVKVGTVKVKATKAEDANYNAITSAEVVITITRAIPTGAPKYTAITTSGKTLADAGLTTVGSTLNPNAGTLVWVDNTGTVLSDTTAVAANTTYKWLFTPADANYTTLTGSIELYHKSSSGGGGWYYTYYTIKATAGTNGSISPSGWTSVRDGRDQTFTITPDKGYAVAKVLVDGKSVGAVKSYTFKNVTKDHTIEVIFMKSNGNPQTGVFVDVAEGSYYEEAIDWAVEKGITNGVSSNMFAPNDPCTRAQIVTFLWRAAGSPAPNSMSSFTDVPADTFYAKAVAWAVENGITSGTGEGKFSPNSTCTRAQAVTFLYRASGSPAVSGSAEFSDVATNAYYADAVAWAAKKGITTGIGGGLFGSDNDCTRGQIVTFLWRAMAE